MLNTFADTKIHSTFLMSCFALINVCSILVKVSFIQIYEKFIIVVFKYIDRLMFFITHFYFQYANIGKCNSQ